MTSAFDDPVRFMMELRPPSEVAARCIILCCVAAHSEDTSLVFDDWLKAEGLWPSVSPKESEFLLNSRPTKREVIQASWRKESFLALMWSLGKINSLPTPQQTESFAAVLELVPSVGKNAATFVSEARSRSFDEIASTYEEVYGTHSQIRDARINGKPAPEGFEAGVIYERHYALNWLRKYGVFEEQEWDDVTTDT